MPNIEPTKDQFDDTLQVLTDALASEYMDLNTKEGSTVRELLVRPLAYLYAWVNANEAQHLADTSMNALMQSQATDNQTADAVAANYFVTRQSGTRSYGLATMVVRTPTIQIPGGYTYSVEGVTIYNENTIVAAGAMAGVRGNIQYVPMTAFTEYDDVEEADVTHYMFTFPVAAQQTGRVEVEAGPGVEVTPNFRNPAFVRCYLTSAITGGRDVETDASMLERAKYNTADAGIGSYYGIKKRLADSPVKVLGMNILGGEDSILYRARYNSVNINPGGYIDCYIKTQTQPSVDDLIGSVQYDSATSSHVIVLEGDGDPVHAGIYAVRGVLANGERITTYSVDFLSDTQAIPADGARLGVHQRTVVVFTTATAVTSLEYRITVTYCPGIFDVQQYLDTDGRRFVGQDICVKAAVPVPVKLDCVLQFNGELTDTVGADIKAAIVDRVNAYPVGTSQLNFSDLREAVARTVAGAELRLPCTMSATIIRKDSKLGSFYSTSGVLDIGHSANYMAWPAAVCYFSLIGDNIRLVAP